MDGFGVYQDLLRPSRCQVDFHLVATESLTVVKPLGNARSSVRLLLLLYELFVSSCSSGVQTGSIAGHVSGASGISIGASTVESQVPAVPNVNVTIKNTTTLGVRSTRTDFSGDFSIEGLTPGHYQVSFAASPFEQQVHATVVRPGQTVDASTRMLIGRDPYDIVDISGCPTRPVGGPPPPEVGSVEIQLRRTACYGPCPAYSVDLFGDGRVEYHGHLHVSVLGGRSYRIEPLAVTELAKRFYEKGFFNFCSSYRMKATDMSSDETTIHLGNIVRTVFVYGDKAPEGLEDLQKQIEQTANVARFVESPDSHQ